MAEFGFNSTFYLNFTGRNDWFTLLNKFYPFVSGSFVFSELLKNLNCLDFAKLRGSWAKVGTDPSPRILIGSDFDTGTVIEKEIGLEARLFNNKLYIDLAAFNKVSSDQELSFTVSDASGLPDAINHQETSEPVMRMQHCQLQEILCLH